MKSAFDEKEDFVIRQGALYLSERLVSNSTVLCTHLSAFVANAERCSVFSFFIRHKYI